jgi:predicted S18 family serine protease
MNRITCLLVLLLTSLIPAFGQSPSDSPQEEAVVVSTNLVTVNVIVTDQKAGMSKA